MSLSGRRIVVGVTGSIAAYKACELVSRLRQAGAQVWVVMTRSAQEFVGAATLRALSGRNVAGEMFEPYPEADIGHVSMAEFGEVLIVAPATANVLGKAANGICDDLLTTTISAAAGTVIFAPAMNWRMWENPLTQANVRRLQQHGRRFVGPECGWLACGEDEKPGRLAGVELLIEAIETALRDCDARSEGGRKPLAGRRVMVTAGPTREWIDAVRFISNPSTGKMGYALATEAARRGAEVLLVSGPTALSAPEGVQTLPVETADQMAEAVFKHLPGTGLFIGAAAVGDWQPVQAADGKLKKDAGPPQLELRPTPDTIAAVCASPSRPAVVVGFAAETDDVLANAEDKLRRKGLDLIVANDVRQPGAAFGADTNAVTIITADGAQSPISVRPKDEIAQAVLDAAQALLASRAPERRDDMGGS